MSQKISYYHSLFHAVAVFLYVIVVASIMSSAGKIFQPLPEVIGGVAFLMLFTLSAAVVGWFIVGKPLLLYIDGKKKDAVQFFGLTMFWLVFFTILAFAIGIIFS